MRDLLPQTVFEVFALCFGVVLVAALLGVVVLLWLVVAAVWRGL